MAKVLGNFSFLGGAAESAGLEEEEEEEEGEEGAAVAFREIAVVLKPAERSGVL
jgi:hypothetical protein